MRTKTTILTAFFLCTVFLSCDTKDTNAEQRIILLNEIASIEGYSELPLTGIDWKMIGFADAKRGKVKMAEPESDRCYRLQFYDNNTLSGISSTNQLTGTYDITLEFSIRIDIQGMTKINELYDGKLYLKCLSNVKSYSITEKGLALYYDNNNYLLFKPLNYEN